MLASPAPNFDLTHLDRFLQEHLAYVQAGLLTEVELVDSVTRVLMEHGQQPGVLTEGIVSGLAGLLAPGSTARTAAQQLAGKVQQAGQQLVDKGRQAVHQVKADYQAGSAAGSLQQLATKRAKAEQTLAGKLADYKQQVQQIQLARNQLRREHRALMRQFHQQAHAEYVRAAQALQIPVSKGDAFYDAVDQALDQRKLIPQVLREADQGLQFPSPA